MKNIDDMTSNLLLSVTSFIEDLINTIVQSKFQIPDETIVFIHKFMPTCFTLMNYVCESKMKKDLFEIQISSNNKVPSGKDMPLICERTCNILSSTVNYFDAQMNVVMDTFICINGESLVALNRFMAKYFTFLNYTMNKDVKLECEGNQSLAVHSNEVPGEEDKINNLLLASARYFEILSYSIIDSNSNISKNYQFILNRFMSKCLRFINYAVCFEKCNAPVPECNVNKFDERTVEILLHTARYLECQINFIMESKFSIPPNLALLFNTFLSNMIIFMNFIYVNRDSFGPSAYKFSDKGTKATEKIDTGKIKIAFDKSNALNNGTFCVSRSEVQTYLSGRPVTCVSDKKYNVKELKNIYTQGRILKENYDRKFLMSNHCCESAESPELDSGINLNNNIHAHDSNHTCSSIKDKFNSSIFSCLPIINFDPSKLRKYHNYVGHIFNSYIENILSGAIKDSKTYIYCHPCDSFVTKGQPWLHHLKYDEHLNSVKQHIEHIENAVMYKCSCCSLAIFGEFFIANILYCIHLKVIHFENTTNSNFKEEINWTDLVVKDMRDSYCVSSVLEEECSTQTNESINLVKCRIQTGQLLCGYLRGISAGTITKNQIGVFCHPCNSVVTKGKPWSRHLNFCQHLELVKKRIHIIDNAIMYRCSSCSFEIFAEFFIANLLYCVHLNVVHAPGSGVKVPLDGENQEEINWTSLVSTDYKD